MNIIDLSFRSHFGSSFVCTAPSYRLSSSRIMSPRKGSRNTCSVHISPKVIADLAAGLPCLGIGMYGEKSGIFPSVLLSWNAVLTPILKAAPTALVFWECLKKAFVRLLDKFPRLDPYLMKAEWTVLDTAEELATGVRKMLSAIRKASLEYKRFSAGLNKCSTQDEKTFSWL